jgi:uncharacterized protein
MPSNAKQWISSLNLAPHPEGGFFREVYRSKESITQDSLPDYFTGNRSFSTSIYYLLDRSDISRFHRIASDEIWVHIDGSPVVIHCFCQEKGYYTLKCGKDQGTEPLQVVPQGTWFAAENMDTGIFSLVSCFVSPGFDFHDFKMAKREELLSLFPEHQPVITRFT